MGVRKRTGLGRLRRREPRLLRPTGRLAANVWDDRLAREVDGLIANGTDAERADAEAVKQAVEHKRRTVAGGAPDAQVR